MNVRYEGIIIPSSCKVRWGWIHHLSAPSIFHNVTLTDQMTRKATQPLAELTES